MTENVESTINETKKELDMEKMERIIQLFGIMLCFMIAFGLAYTQIWPLAFLAAIIGGAFFTEMKKGVLVGTICVGLGWTIYVIIQIVSSNVMTLINQVIGIIIGNESLGWIIVVAIVVIAFIIGALGGTLGSAIRKLIQNMIIKKKI
ncbi:MAG: hypothetical protein FK730_15770 [Asgard group archaeon]|nr:hypothetical protein [Asgard group archaeon]